MASIKINEGPYVWCGNNYDGEKSGYYLTKGIGAATKLSSYPEKEIMVVLSFDIPQSLVDNIMFIQIYDETGFLVNYNGRKITNNYKCSFKVDKSLCGTKLKICYDIPSNIQPKSSFLSRIKTDTIHTEYLTIPNILIKGEKMCTICLEDASDNIYISKCEHIFHINCLWEYLENRGFLNPIAENCKFFKCDHIEKPKPFPCPVCRTMCETPRY